MQRMLRRQVIRSNVALFAAALLFLCIPAAGAQPAQLVKDINPGPDSSAILGPVKVGNTLLFAADDGTNGQELWRSDGTEAGTVLLKDVNPGPASSGLELLSIFNDKLYFFAYDGTSGIALWESDGTAAGTQIVEVINPTATAPGAFDGAVRFRPFNGSFYFTADDGTHGSELWKSDGTASGTMLVKDINPGAEGSSILGILILFNGELYFAAKDGTNGVELWKTDGTAAGTVLVKDINPNPVGPFGFGGSSNPGGFTVFNSALYFDADDGSSGEELWKTDGTTSGTQLAIEINAGADGSALSGLTLFDGMLYFAADDGTSGTELWKSNGTAGGTVLVKDINPGADGSIPVGFTPLNGALYFAAAESIPAMSSPLLYYELWKTDGTEAGTQLVKDINPGPEGSIFVGFFQVINNNLVFPAANEGSIQDPETANIELWKSDGTAAGTQLVADINPGSDSSIPFVFVQLGNTVYFTAKDDAHGRELWKIGASRLPVELAALRAVRRGDTIELTWMTLAEHGSDRFEVQRAISGDGDVASTGRLALRWKTLGTVDAVGASTEAQRYRFTDEEVPFTADRLVYRLKQVDLDGSVTYSSTVEMALGTPERFALHEPSPNPATQQATIRYELPEAAHVRLAVYDVLGRRVALLADGRQEAGPYEMHLKTSRLAPGVYFLRLRTGSVTKTQQLVIVR